MPVVLSQNGSYTTNTIFHEFNNDTAYFYLFIVRFNVSECLQTQVIAYTITENVTEKPQIPLQ